MPRVVKKVKFELSPWKRKSHIEETRSYTVVLLVCGPIEKMSLIEKPENNFPKKTISKPGAVR